ncbi:MAG: acyl-ACP--UDP-N-acetylglucosamine O-acyltransferase [candidate division WOR-3 bacterium]|nr:acyl-ACP--UDP-N-acetylglucosamine O-acyltransferase [candidate division WOR-3 bacterium]
MTEILIGKKTKIHKSVRIGKFSIIEDGVEIGEGTEIGNFVLVKKGTKIGKNNKIYSGAQLGIDPQDYHFKGEYSECVIGDGNIIREYATISRATGKNERTVIGNNNFIMTYVHIAHNCKIGNNVVIASGTQIAGYVEIDDFAYIGGLVGIHQFCRVGKYAMLGAKSYLNKDLPPYFLARGNRARIYGINRTGLLRRNFTNEEIEEIKEIFRVIYKSNRNINELIPLLRNNFSKKFSQELISFIKKSQRGIILK